MPAPPARCSRANPAIEVFVHERGARHLIDPSKLMASATRLYGQDMERLWGECCPCRRRRCACSKAASASTAGGRDLEVAYTPGHASITSAYFDRSQPRRVRRRRRRHPARQRQLHPAADAAARHRSRRRGARARTASSRGIRTRCSSRTSVLHGGARPHFQQLFDRLDVVERARAQAARATRRLDDQERERALRRRRRSTTSAARSARSRPSTTAEPGGSTTHGRASRDTGRAIDSSPDRRAAVGMPLGPRSRRGDCHGPVCRASHRSRSFAPCRAVRRVRADHSVQPTPAPAVTAENEPWFVSRAPLLFGGTLYFPAGPQVHFNQNEMVRTGFYGAVPVYVRTTLEPRSVIFVPLSGGVMQPYERRRSGELAGTEGSRGAVVPDRERRGADSFAAADAPGARPAERRRVAHGANRASQPPAMARDAAGTSGTAIANPARRRGKGEPARSERRFHRVFRAALDQQRPSCTVRSRSVYEGRDLTATSTVYANAAYPGTIFVPVSRDAAALVVPYSNARSR